MRLVGTRTAWMVVAAVVVAAVALSASLAWAEISTETKAKVEAVNRLLEQVPGMIRAKDLDKLGATLEQIEAEVAELKAGGDQEELAKSVLPIMQHRVEAAQRLLAISLESAPKPKPKEPPTDMLALPTNSTISFVKDVAPLLVSKCKKCHIDQDKGGFSVATYADIFQGSENGQVFVPGKAVGSTLVESLVTGDMPRGSAQLTDLEISRISKWIDEGARFDGTDPSIELVELIKGGDTMVASSTPATDPKKPGKPGPTPPPRQGPRMPGVPSADGSVSFQYDIAPIIVDHCYVCHNTLGPPNDYRVSTFNRFMTSGKGGNKVQPGDLDGSLLIQKLRGTASEGKRMPPNQPLSDDQIKMFEKWVAGGAKFDGDDPNTELSFEIKVLTSLAMSHEELAAWRMVQLRKKWELGNPDTPYQTFEDDGIRVMSDITPGRMKDLEATVKGVKAKVVDLLKVPAGRPFVKGKLCIYVFDKRFEQSEFSRMVEKRDVPGGLRSYFFFDFVDAYCSLVASESDKDPDFNAQLVEQMTGAYVQSLSRYVPTWFAMGTGRAAVARLDPKNPKVKEWDASIRAAEVTTGRPEDFLGAKTLDAKGAVVAYGLVKSLMADPRFIPLVRELEKGTNFDQAFTKIYGRTPLAVYQAWAPMVR